MRLLFLFIFLNTFNTWSQVIFDKTTHDFNEISSNSERFVDIHLTNKGEKKEYILSVKKPNNVVYLVNGQFIEPDSSLTVRLQVNPTIKGRFSYEVKIYTSDKDDATIVKLKGNLTEIKKAINPFQACPDFNSTPKKNQNNNFDLTVITIDKSTKKPIENSIVSLLQNGEAKWTLNTNIKGEITQKSESLRCRGRKCSLC